MKVRTFLFALLLSLGAIRARGQGCAMCYSTAAATNQDGQRAISKGVVILLVPPCAFMTLGVWLAFRYSKRRDREVLQGSAC
jgi:hypothetical protein